MNEAYGFGTFRNAIWLEHSATMAPQYEVGYHALFLPLVDLAYRSRWRDHPAVRLLRRVGERVVRKRTADIWRARRGGMDLEGRIYRAVLEPLCYVAGTIKGLWR
jgi:hypothetical protein